MGGLDGEGGNPGGALCVCVCTHVHVYAGRCACVCLQDVYTEGGLLILCGVSLKTQWGQVLLSLTRLFSDGNWPAGFLSQNLQQETPLQLQPSLPFSCLRPRD